MLFNGTSDPLTQLLVDQTRRAEVVGPALANTHRAVGRRLAVEIAKTLVLETVAIEHSTGLPSEGVRLRPGAEPIIVAMMRAGLPLALGLWETLPGSSLVFHGTGQDALEELPACGRSVIVVDAVINSGGSIQKVLEQAAGYEPASLLAVALVGLRPTLERLAQDLPAVGFVVARVSERSYSGSGATDTGARIFGTTTWKKER